MSKQDRERIRAFEEALGTSSIYIGESGAVELVFPGALHQRVVAAKRARELARTESDNPVVVALRGLTQIIDGDIGYDLDELYEHERDIIAKLVSRLTIYYDNHTSRATER